MAHPYINGKRIGRRRGRGRVGASTTLSPTKLRIIPSGLRPMVAKRVPSDAAAVISNISLTSGKATPVEFVVTVALAEVGAEGPTRKVSIR